MNQIETCLTPELIHQYSLSGKITVVVDIFRATSCMVAGMAHGVKSIHPVASIEECLELGAQGMITAGERGGVKVDGFRIGNSPFEYMQAELSGQSIAVSTTNGTKTILASTDSEQILIGAFLNLGALAAYLGSSGKDVVVHCAGWQGTVNIEDTLFAGALISRLGSSHMPAGDPALLALQLYTANEKDLLQIAKSSSHAHRLASFGIEKDIEFCMEQNLFTAIPEYKDKALRLLD